MLLIALVVVAAVVIRLMTVDERKKYTARALEFGQQIRAARANIRPCEPLRTNLRERTPRVFVAPAIATALVFTFVTGNSLALANVGPQTTAGEWWRLLSAGFVAPSFTGLIAILIGFVQPALLLERLVGHIALAAVFVAAAATAGVVQLAANPVGVNVASIAALCGVYGLLAVSIASGRDPTLAGHGAVPRGQADGARHGAVPALFDRERPVHRLGKHRLHHRTGMRCGARVQGG